MGEEGSDGDRDRNHILGSSFWLDGVLVAISDACESYVEEPKVGHLLRDALRWEGDPDTVVVVGSASDVAAGDVAPVADCAADLYRAEEEMLKRERPQLQMAGPAADVVPLPGSKASPQKASGE